VGVVVADAVDDLPLQRGDRRLEHDPAVAMELGQPRQLDKGAHLVATDGDGRQIRRRDAARPRLGRRGSGRAGGEQAGQGQDRQEQGARGFAAHARYERLKTAFG